MPKIFNEFFVKSIHSTPQSSTDTPFRAPMPAISHLDFLGFQPE